MDNLQIIQRLLIALIMGGVIGYERESQGRPAGLITNILVCIGSAITSMIQLSLYENSINNALMYPEIAGVIKVDSGRIIGQVISGIGFLGAGTIIHNKGSVKGLTTAATLWVVACIGIAVGMGYYFLSIASTITVYCTLVILRSVKYRIQDKNSVI